MPFRTMLVVEEVDANLWQLVNDLVYEGSVDHFVVPAGFLTDFASVPRMFWWLVPRYGRFTKASVLHDWLYTLVQDGSFHSCDADGIFRRSMRELGVSFLRRWLMWTAVRWASGVYKCGVRQLLLVLVITLLSLPIVLPGGLVVLTLLLVFWILELLTLGVRTLLRQQPTALTTLRWLRRVPAGTTQGAEKLADAGRYEEASRVLSRTLSASERLGDTQATASAHQSLGSVLAEQGDFKRARLQYERALALYREVDSAIGEYAVLNSLGRLYLFEGNLAEADEHFQTGRKISARLQDRSVEVQSLLSRAAVADALDKSEEAESYLRQGLDIARKTKNDRLIAYVEGQLGGVLARGNNPEEAVEVLQNALSGLAKVGDRRAALGVQQLLGLTLLAADQPEKAAEPFREAVELSQEMGIPVDWISEDASGVEHLLDE